MAGQTSLVPSELTIPAETTNYTAMKSNLDLIVLRLPAAPNPAERRRIEEQLEWVLKEERAKFDKAQDRLDRERSRLARERDNLIDKTVEQGNKKKRTTNILPGRRKPWNSSKVSRIGRAMRGRTHWGASPR